MPQVSMKGDGKEAKEKQQALGCLCHDGPWESWVPQIVEAPLLTSRAHSVA